MTPTGAGFRFPASLNKAVFFVLSYLGRPTSRGLARQPSPRHRKAKNVGARRVLPGGTTGDAVGRLSLPSRQVIDCLAPFRLHWAMRVKTLLISLGACALLLGGQADSLATEGAAQPCKRFCVSVTPSGGDTETVFVFKGRNWRPKWKISASYGVYCGPGEQCIAIGRFTTLRANKHGRFVFRFRNGPRPLTEGPRPRASGGGPVTFRQGTGRGPVKRTPGYPS
jgi:hypothetical protein